MAKTEKWRWKENLECPYCRNVVCFCGDTTFFGRNRESRQKKNRI